MFQEFAGVVSTSTAVLVPPDADRNLRSVCGDGFIEIRLHGSSCGKSATQVLEHRKHAAVINL